MTTRFAEVTQTAVLLVLLAGSAAAQNVNPQTVRNLLNRSAAAPAAPSAPAPHVQVPSSKPASSSPKPSAPAAKSPAPSQGQATPAAPGAPADHAAARRDPFDSLLDVKTTPGQSTDALPPGKPGLIINSLRIDGIVKGQNGMIAIVSNAQQRVYFIHEGDKLYDGSVEHISLEAVSFHELGKDAFGKPTDTEVTKRLYPSPGEQQ